MAKGRGGRVEGGGARASLTEWTPLGRTERIQETSSRGVFLKPSPTYGLLPVYAIGSSGRQRNEHTDVPSAIFPKTGANKVPVSERPPPRRPAAPPPRLSTPRDTIVRRVNTFVDRENRRILLHCYRYSENRDAKTNDEL